MANELADRLAIALYMARGFMDETESPEYCAEVDSAIAAYETAQREVAQEADTKTEVDVREEVIDRMVNTFLGWKLPKDFAPDCGVSFKPVCHPMLWPVGTNLFTAAQAKELFTHVLPATFDAEYETLRDLVSMFRAQAIEAEFERDKARAQLAEIRRRVSEAPVIIYGRDCDCASPGGGMHEQLVGQRVALVKVGEGE